MSYSRRITRMCFFFSMSLGCIIGILINQKQQPLENKDFALTENQGAELPRQLGRRENNIESEHSISSLALAAHGSQSQNSVVSNARSELKLEKDPAKTFQTPETDTTLLEQALPVWPARLRELANHSFDLDELTHELSRRGFQVKTEQKGNPVSGKRVEISAKNKFGETVFSQYFVDDSGQSSFDSISLKASSNQDAFADLVQQSETQFGLDPNLRKGKSLAAVYGIDGKEKTLSLIFDKSSSSITVTIEKTECENAL